MATITTGYTWADGNVVTASLLNQSVNAASVSGIINADLSSSAAIADSKLATISTAGKVSGTSITSGDISTSGNLTSSGKLTATGGFYTSSTAVPINRMMPKAWASFRGNLGTLTGLTFSQANNVGANTTTITFSTSTAHGLKTGDFVTISNSTGNMFDGTWQINVISTASFVIVWNYLIGTTITAATINPISVNSLMNVYSIANTATGIYSIQFGASSQLAITALSCSGTTATATAANSLSVGQFVTIFGSTISGSSTSGYNGVFQVTAASSTSFSYVVSTTLAASASATAIFVPAASSPFQDINYVMTGSVNYLGTATGSQGMGISAINRSNAAIGIRANTYNGTAADAYEIDVVFFGN